jgi:predicted Co/Zn/Cd cation transporter (cation efflux family)
MANASQAPEAIERQSLEIGKWGNLLMAVAGVVASFLSRSDALLVDGLYSGVNFFSAIIAAKITMTVAQPRDRRYPFGYDAHEALYVTFRSLVLLGIMAFAVFGAVGKIVTYARGEEIPELQFGPILVYAAAMVATCLALAAWHRHNWRRSGEQSEILSTESRAAVVDAIISGGVGVGFLASMFLQGTVVEFIVPVSDSIIVLVLCVVIAGQPVTMFLGALRQVAGASAEQAVVDQVSTHLQDFLEDRPFELLDVAVTKMGRSYFVVSYVKPDRAVDGDAADGLWQQLNTSVLELLGQAKTELIIAAQPPFGARSKAPSND